MNKQLENVLRAVAEETFEELAFLLPVDEEEFMGCSDETRAVEVAFDGPFSGIVRIVVTADVLTELAGNMLGLEGDRPSPEQQADALKELANVVASCFLNTLADRAGSELRPTEPFFVYDMLAAVLEGLIAEQSLMADKAILIDTNMAEHEKGIGVHFLFLPSPKLIESIAAHLTGESELTD